MIWEMRIRLGAPWLAAPPALGSDAPVRKDYADRGGFRPGRMFIDETAWAGGGECAAVHPVATAPPNLGPTLSSQRGNRATTGCHFALQACAGRFPQDGQA